MISQIVVIAILVLCSAAAVFLIVRKLRRGGGCCGEHDQAVQRVRISDRNKSHYPYSMDLRISGMTCSNCAVRIENALNSSPGIWAAVDKNTNSARVLSKEEQDPELIRSVIAKAGYSAEIV